MKTIKTLLLAGLLSLGAFALSGVSYTNLAEAQPCSSSASKEDVYTKQVRIIKDKKGEKSCGLMELVHLDDYLSGSSMGVREAGSLKKRHNLPQEVEYRKYIAALKHFLEADVGYSVKYNSAMSSWCHQIGSSLVTG